MMKIVITVWMLCVLCVIFGVRAQDVSREMLPLPSMRTLPAMTRALFEAIDSNDSREIDRLISLGVHFPARNDDGESPLYVAAEKGSLDALRLLIAGRSDVRLRTPNGETALHAAAMQDDPTYVRLLIEAGAQPNTVNRNGETPLAWAAMTGTLPAAQLLVESGAIINATDERGNTPMHGAAVAGNLEIIAFLLRRKARATERNRDGKTPRDIAREREYPAIVRLLDDP